MNKKDVLLIIHKIETYYNNPYTRKRNAFSKDKSDEDVLLEVVDAWHKILREYFFDEIMANLDEYIKTNKFPPSIADLVQAPERKDRAIPSTEETRGLMEKWDKDHKPASKDIANQELAKMRDILGIKRGD